MNKVLKLTSILLLLFSVHPMFSQEIIELDSVEVSASRVSSSIRETGKSVTVISRQDIAAMPVNTVDELLRFIPGVNVNSRNAFGIQSDIGMGGSTFSQVLVMVDNQRLNDPLTAHFNNNIPVALSDIEQIEVIRGPAGASFGPDAVGGVIHIKTQLYIANSSEGKSVQTQGEIGVGEQNLLIGDIGVHAQINRWRFSGSIKAAISDGEELLNPNFRQVASADSLFNNYFDIKTYSAAVSYQFNDQWKAYARVGMDRRDFAAKYFYTRSTFDESTELIESSWSQFVLSRREGTHHTELNAAFKSTDDLFVFNPLFTPNVHNTQMLNVNLNHSLAVNDKGQFAFGTQIGRRTIESTDRGDHSNLSAGFYGVLSYELVPNLTTVTSLRLEYDDNFGVEFLPQLSLAYNRNALTLRASAGKSIRAGDFTERFISSQIPELSPGRNIGNPDLEAEKAYAFDAGVDAYLKGGFKLSGTVFYRLGENMIDYILTNSDQIDNVTNLKPGEDYFYPTNVSQSNTFGIIASVEETFSIGDHVNLKWGMNYTFLETSNSTGAVSKYLADHPTHNFNFMAGVRASIFDLNLYSQWIRRNEESVAAINADIFPNYSITHLKLDVKPFGDKFSFFMKVHNLFGADYQEVLGAQMPGRWVMGGIRWKIDQGK